MKYFLMLFVCISGFTDAITLDELQTKFAKQSVIRADFVQQRQIKNIQRPLVSTGKMILSPDMGLWWQQTRPFIMTLILRNTVMIQRVDGQPDQRITAENNPQMLQFNSLMRALVRADKALLEKNFALDFVDKGNGNWRLRLTPTTMPLDKLFTEIQLTGAEVLRHVVLTDKQGDITEITFSHHRLTPTTLTAKEAHYFE